MGSVHIADTPGGPQQVGIINESGLYSLDLTSRKPEAKAFKKWITSEVLPAIRKTGSYGTQRDPMEALNDPATMRGLLLGYSEKVLALETRVQVMKPNAEALDRIATFSDGSYCLTNAAKVLQHRPKEFILLLQGQDWIYRRIGWDLTGYQDKIMAG